VSDIISPGYGTHSDRKLWEEYRKVQRKVHFGQILKYQRLLNEQFGYHENEKQRFLPLSPYLNLYQYVKELDYHSEIPIAAHFVRVDAYCREELGHFELPSDFANRMQPGDKLIYVSMGSIASIDVTLMRRLVSILGKTRHFYVV